MNQELAVNYLKKKGIGETMGKHLDAEELSHCNALFQSKEIELTTKATLLTAILMLDKTPEEATWLEQAVAKKETIFPTEVWPLIDVHIDTSTLRQTQHTAGSTSRTFNKDPKDTPPRSLSLRCAEPVEVSKGPAPSKNTLLPLALSALTHQDCSFQDTVTATQHVLDPQIPEWQKGVFLEALRLKRETPDENLACLDVYRKHSHRWSVDLPHLVYLSNPFDGMKRHHPLSVFTAILMASIGVPTYLHGVETIAPKYGITTHKLLAAAGKNPLKSPAHCIEDLQDPTIGFTYIDQSHSFPDAYNLIGLRKRMVKRPVLATIEKLCPVFIAQHNSIVTGYTHPPYKEKSIQLCSDGSDYQKYVIVRGTEGSSEINPNKRTRIISGITLSDSIENFVEAPEIQSEEPNDITLESTLELGQQCLSGNIPHDHNPVLHQAYHTISALKLISKDTLIKQLTHAIDSQTVVSRWVNFK